MTHEISLQQMDVEVLAAKCAEETNLYFKRQANNTQYCFELFRRAIQEKSNDAWNFISAQYEGLVTGWVTQHYGFATSGEEAQDFVSKAFSKISITITTEKFASFSDLKSLLRYLKLCVHSVIVDFTRAIDYTNLIKWEETWDEESGEPSPEEQAVDRSERQMLWDLLAARLHDRKERMVIHGSFVLDLKPQEILDHFRGEFNDIDEIYRIKQNVITRLRRDTEFRKFLGRDD
jgi:DNA-directed RNA polymerase specialized sigma24 family protein